MWQRNPALLAKGKLNAMMQRYGGRAIYVPSYDCPGKASELGCGADGSSPISCSSCNQLSNNFKRIYDAPATAERTQELTHGSLNVNYHERLEHRWLIDPPYATTPNGGRFEYEVDFKLNGREVVWIGKTPPPQGKYTMHYKAYAEDNVGLIHATPGPMGGPQRAEEGVVLPTGVFEQGFIGVSIPPEASAYNLDSGDILVLADMVMVNSQAIDLSMRRRRSYNRWIIEIKKALYRRKQRDGSFEIVDATALVSYNFQTGDWDFSKLPKDVVRVSLNYTSAPLFVVNLDVGEMRAPHFALQNKLVRLVQLESSY